MSWMSMDVQDVQDVLDVLDVQMSGCLGCPWMSRMSWMSGSKKFRSLFESRTETLPRIITVVVLTLYQVYRKKY